MEITIILSACRWKPLSFYQPADGKHYHSISLQMKNTIIPSACRWKSLSSHQPADGKYYHSISLQMENTIIPSACRCKSLSACRRKSLSACRWKSLSLHQPADRNHCHCISLQMEITVIASACREKSLSLHQPADGNHYHSISLQMEIIIHILNIFRPACISAWSPLYQSTEDPQGTVYKNTNFHGSEIDFPQEKRTAEEGKNPLPPAPSFQSFSFEAIPMPATPCFHIDILCAVPSTNMQKSKSCHYQVTLHTRQVTGIKGSVMNEN